VAPARARGHQRARGCGASRRDRHGRRASVHGPGDCAGELVIALGHPLGVANAAALGVVHRAPTGAPGPAGWLHADIRLAPGNSGGPLADAAGRVAGINAMIAGGLGIAVPTHVIEQFVHEVLAGGRGGARAA
jgi:serine protease Do